MACILRLFGKGKTCPAKAMRFTKLLGFKLFAIVLVMTVAGTFAFATLTIRWHSERYLRNQVRSISHMSDVLSRSMHYSMLLNRREDVYQIITTVGSEPDIEAVRIYNKRGVITFSSKKDELGTIAHFSDKACFGCHSEGETVVNPSADLTRIFPSAQGYRVLGMITPIRNQRSCSDAECHAHPQTQTVLGVLDVMVPLSDLDASLEELQQVQYLSAGATVLVLTSLVGIFIWVMVNRPVRRLIQGTREIRRGNLDHRIAVSGNDEISSLATSFNQMTDDLQRARDELTEWNRTLEERVHQKTEELRRAQAHLIQMEKMASLGTLAATVAHELNNPLEGVLTYAKLMKRRVERGNLTPSQYAETVQELGIIAEETARCGNIVKNLLLFSRLKVGTSAEVDLRAVVQQSTRLIDHHLKMHNIELELQLGETPLNIVCDSSQIEQALLAIEINAVEAMPEGGKLTIALEEDRRSNSLRIIVRDTGYGISEEDMPHIFEPFYTTKHDGKGTGLGLSVVYGIVEGHGGKIAVSSQTNEGTSFTITLPRRQPAKGETS